MKGLCKGSNQMIGLQLLLLPVRPGSLTASLAVFPSLQQTLRMVDSNECLGHCDDRFKVKGITDDCG